MKRLLICILFLLLPSCSLFESTPKAVISGQRAVYQSVLIGEARAMRLINRYVEDCKKLVAYHENYIMQLDIQDTESREGWDRKTKNRYNGMAQKKRDKQLKKAYGLIDKRADKMRQEIKKHYVISLKLAGSVYNYLSTSPIEIDNMEFWIKKLDQISNQSSGTQ